MPLSGLTEELHRGVQVQLGAIEKRRQALLAQMKGEPPQSEVGKLQTDRRRLLSEGQGEGSPAIKAIDRQIAGFGQQKEEAQSPVGKLVEDVERATRMYGSGSPQVAAIREVLAQARGGGEAKATDIRGMRQEFTALSKDFREIRDRYAAMQEPIRNPSAAGDLTVIYSFMKMLDPGSVVRESEFATAANAGGVPDRVRAMWNRALRGERLADPVRQDFMRQATGVFESQVRVQRGLEKQYQGLARRRGFAPDDVVVDFIGAVGGVTPPSPPSLEDAKETSRKAKQEAIGAVERLRNLLRK
jgi:hypothetical protein